MSIFYIQKYREMVYFWRLWSTFAYTSWLWSIISPERNIHFWSNKKYLKEKTLHIFMIALSHFHWGSNNSPFSDPRPPLKIVQKQGQNHFVHTMTTLLLQSYLRKSLSRTKDFFLFFPFSPSPIKMIVLRI